MPKVSLIIALYNAKKYLRECLDSVENQTFKDWECLCVNDGSTDETEEIVSEYAKRDPRFRIINQENKGCSVARNTGIDNAAAPYIALLDQDDVLHPQAFEALVYLIDKYKTDIATFKHKIVPDDFRLKNPETYDFSKVEAKVSTTPFQDFRKRKKGGQVEVWTRLYKKEALGGIGFPPQVQPAEDTVFTLKAFYNAKSIVSIDTELLFYRDSQTSVMNQGKNEKYIRSHYKAATVLHSFFFKEHKLEGEDARWMEYFISRIVFKTCISQPLRRVKDKETQKYLLNIANELVTDLYKRKIFVPSTQGIRYSMASHLFLKKHYKLAKVLL